MSGTKTTRRDAARAVGLFLGTPEGRELFARNHYVSETRILAVPESEPFDSVLSDHLDHGADTIVAVFFPDRRGDERFGFLKWEMPATDLREDWSAEDAMTLGRGSAGHTSSIGAVVDMMKAQRFTWLGPERRLPAPEVSALLKRLSARAFAAA
ncbi:MULTISPECIES: hypothetical protein [unclassified Actinomyces]|uniref:hypothetical protein n=1 Tax=unclassified Actinomyces TaxID=2609248 RepID=UPI000D594A2E|nr:MULTISPECIES: hypothetical protein [unclassified Actinomyces]RAX22139.1 hypothetical protein DRB07_08980 [Actinomyces sp. Z3]